MTKTFQITEEVRDYIQKFHYEMDAVTNLLSVLWSKEDRNMEAIDYYTKKYNDAFASFEQAKKDIAIACNIDTSNCTWNLDYATCVLTAEGDFSE